MFIFFSSRRRHTRLQGDWSSDVCSSDLRASGSSVNPNWRPAALSTTREEDDTAVASVLALAALLAREYSASCVVVMYSGSHAMAAQTLSGQCQQPLSSPSLRLVTHQSSSPSRTARRFTVPPSCTATTSAAYSCPSTTSLPSGQRLLCLLCRRASTRLCSISRTSASESR